jgi:surface polysaccharide O-acyltransferase-like enzyme
MNTEKHRNPSLDLIRSIAIILVAEVHSINRIYSFTLKGMNSLSSYSFIFGNFMHSLGQMGVPLFLMLTGYLLLPRDYDTVEDITSFWKKKLIPLVICYEIWVAVYELFASFVIHKKTFTFTSWLRHACMLEDFEILRHMWYLPTIIGIYIFIPFISIILKKYSPKLFILPLLAGYIYIFVVPTANIFLNGAELIPLTSKINVAYMGAHNGMYVLAGYFFKVVLEPRLQAVTSKKKALFLSLGGTLLALICTALTMCWSYTHGHAITVTYNNAFLPLFGFGLFSLVFLIGESIPFQKLWRSISLMSFGIFFFHYPIMLLVLEHFRSRLLVMKKPLGALILFSVIFFGAYIISACLSRFIPKVAQVLFLKKPEPKKDMPANENLS